MIRSPALSSLVLGALLAPTLHASDWYVDAVGGSNANSGASPQSAWRTITHALAASPQTGAQTIHVAAGLYDAALGEAFPLDLRPQLQLIGAGAGTTVVHGSAGAVTLISAQSLLAGSGWAIGADVLVQGLTLEAGSVGIGLFTDWSVVEPVVRDVHIVSMAKWGVAATSGGFAGAGTLNPRFERVTIEACDAGVRFSSAGSACDLELVGCALVDSARAGLEVFGDGSLDVGLRRTQVVRSGAHGISTGFWNYGAIRVEVEDSLVAASGGAGFHADDVLGLVGSVDVFVRRSTVAGNTTAGVRALGNLPGNKVYRATIEDAIVFGNGDDLAYDGPMVVARSDIGDGDFQGQAGNLAVDPLFVNPAQGDWRLSYGSPCVDVGDPQFIRAGPDIEGRLRRFDGALDGLDQPDLGAYELQVLQLLGEPRVGAQVDVAVHGPAGVTAPIFRAFAPLHPTPRNHPFGPLLLRRTAMVLGAAPAAQPGPPAIGRIAIPNNPVLAGMSFSIQALVRPTPGAGFRWTNAETALVQP